jgi:hypothetical protein
VNAGGGQCNRLDSRERGGRIRLSAGLLCLWALLLSAAGARAGLQLSTGNPEEFFTNVAARLLKSDLNVDLTHIPIYPTNQYTPAAHRLLQVTANLYDSTTTNAYPTMFRPHFSNDGTNIYISGYEEVDPTNTSFLTVPADLNVAVAGGWISNGTRLNIYGIPWIIGAKKGLPNFNEVLLQSVAQITRKLRITKPSLTSPFSAYRTSQMLIIGISNVLGVEVWNSYSNNYPRAVYIQADGDLTMTLTNDVGLPLLITNLALGGAHFAANMGAIELAADAWPGTGWSPGGYHEPNRESFQVPLLTNVVFLPDSAFQQHPCRLQSSPPGGPDEWSAIATNYFPQPHWGLRVTGRIRCLILDGGPPGQGRVVDYVQLNGMNTFRDLGGELDTKDVSQSINNLWSTNPAAFFLGTNTVGIMNQIYISLGNPVATDSDWADRMIGAPSGLAKEHAIDYFRNFLKLNPLYDRTVVNTQLVMQAPFTPTSKKVQLLTWQANDPLVHYTVDDLNDLAPFKVVYSLKATQLVSQAQSNFWGYTTRYEPWGGNPQWGPFSSPHTATDLALKDPVKSSDDWDFPSGEPLSFATIGRIHRGTPWQTVYLKSTDVPAGNTWLNWTGNTNALDATYTRPAMDRNLISLLGPWLTTHCLRHRLSINNADAEAWLAVLDGLPVFTNSAPAATLVMASNSPQALTIAQGINDTRSRPDLFPSGLFLHLGDLLATPQLTEQSPFLNTNLWYVLYQGTLTDEILECLPSRLLPLLREDSFGLIVKTNDQVILQFSGYDGHAYVIQASRNLVDWVGIGAYYPTNGVVCIPASVASRAGCQFYRSLLLPWAASNQRRFYLRPHHRPAHEPTLGSRRCETAETPRYPPIDIGGCTVPGPPARDSSESAVGP